MLIGRCFCLLKGSAVRALRHLLVLSLIGLSALVELSRGETVESDEDPGAVVLTPRHGQILSEKDLGDFLRSSISFRTSGEKLYGRISTGMFAGVRGNSLKILYDGIEIPGKDYRGADLGAIPVEILDSVYVDPYRPALKIKSWSTEEKRPFTWVRTLMGSRSLTIASAGFSRKVGQRSRVYFSGHGGSVKDRLASKDFSDNAFYFKFDSQTSRDLALSVSTFGCRSSKQVPYIPGLRYPGTEDLSEGLPRKIRDWRRFISAEVNFGPAGARNLSAKAWADLLNRRIDRSGVTPAERDDLIYGFSVGTSTRKAGAYRASVEASYKNESFEASTDSRIIWDLYSLEAELTLYTTRGLTLRGWFEGKRHSSFDYDLDFGAVTSFSPSERLSLSVGGGRFIRYPTFDETNWQGYEWADPVVELDLNPESRSFLRSEARLRFSEALSLVVSGFIDRTDDLIDFTVDTDKIDYSNITRAGFIGSNISLAFSLPPLADFGLSYSLISGKDTGSNSSLYHLPKNNISGFATLEHPFFEGKMRLKMDLLCEWVGKSYGYDISSDSVIELKGTTIVDIRFIVKILDDFQTFYRIDNLLDSRYRIEASRTAQGRSYLWGVRWNFLD